MVDHSDRSYFQTHVNNSSRPQLQQEWEDRGGSRNHSLFLWLLLVLAHYKSVIPGLQLHLFGLEELVQSLTHKPFGQNNESYMYFKHLDL